MDDIIKSYNYKNLVSNNLASRMLCETKYDVDERGIIEFNQWTDALGEIKAITVPVKVVIPKEIFVKAYNMFIKGEED